MLSGIVNNQMSADLRNGDVFIFVNKNRNRIKLLRKEPGGEAYILTYEVVGLILNGDLNTKEKLIKETDFIEYCQNLYKQRYDQGKISYSYWYNNSLVINHFRDFFKEKVIDVIG